MQKAVGIIGGFLVFAIISLIPLDPVTFPYPAQLGSCRDRSDGGLVDH
jgi:hypothetical protein